MDESEIFIEKPSAGQAYFAHITNQIPIVKKETDWEAVARLLADLLDSCPPPIGTHMTSDEWIAWAISDVEKNG